MRRARAGVQGVRAVRAGACRVCRMGGHGIRAGKACGVGAASANDWMGPARQARAPARFLLLFLKKKSPAGIRRIKRCGIICENSSGESPIAFPHPWRPIPFALSTVRNGRVALPQERLPSAPLLTGLPPRCIPHCGRSAPPLSKGAFWLMRFQAFNALSSVVRIRKPLEFTTPKRPLFERGWQRASADGGLPGGGCRAAYNPAVAPVHSASAIMAATSEKSKPVQCSATSKHVASPFAPLVWIRSASRVSGSKQTKDLKPPLSPQCQISSL